METKNADIPVLQKIRIIQEVPVTAACCAPKNNATVCCAPASAEDNTGACCAQPEDGSSCCDKD